ncbi:hypothetical protein [Ectopseudomonas khazarica]|uniref:hypothetical protein n=1 Tax=Ectopseudomonas khazarica TaxID=2502979 RepID=UPI00106E5F39|nr:hypothetical protein [Pseudomonas khazarica]
MAINLDRAASMIGKLVQVARRLTVASGALIAIAVVSWAAGIILQERGLKDPAAWVQAVGTLIAIAVAIAIPAWQKQTQVEEKRDEEFVQRKLTIECVRSLVNHQRTLLGSMQIAVADRETGKLSAFEWKLLGHRLAENRREMEDLKVDAFGPRFVPHVLDVKGVAAMMCLIESTESNHYEWPQACGRLLTAVDLMQARFNELVSMEEDLFEAFGKPYV